MNWFDKAEQENNVESYRQSDVRRVIAETEANLKRGGTSASDYGKLLDASQQAGIKDAVDRMSKIAENGPPLSSEMLQNPDRYYSYRDSVVEGTPFSKASSFNKQGYFTGTSYPSYAQGGMPIYTDPLNSPSRWGIPTWSEDMPEDQKEELQKETRRWCNWYYRNHHIVPTCMNIYATYPFVGLDIQCPDPQVEDEYKQVFLGDCNYEKLLPEGNLQFWKNGEAPMFAEWDDVSKSWVAERILKSDDIKVIAWPGPDTDKEAYFWFPPEDLRKMLEYADADDPIFLWYLNNFGDEQILDWMEGKPSELPADVFSLLRHDQDIGGTRGYPLLMRAFGALMKEEKMNQAMTAVAERLYTPFIVAKLGSKDLLQGQYPWIPTDNDLKKMQAHIEMVMTSKYRVMVYHSGIEFENPFANQNIPDLNDDFDRVTKDIMGVFGISPGLIYGGSGDTYAAGALSAEIMMQKLSTSQKMWSRWCIRDRAERVAEARGYYQVERKGKTWTKPMERVRVYDPETQSYRMKTRRKLMLPAIRMETMDWRDQQQTLANLLDLKAKFGVAISTGTILGHIDPNVNLEAEREQYSEELEADHLMRQSLAERGIQEVPMGGGRGGMPGGMGGGRGMPHRDVNGPNPNGPDIGAMPGGAMPGGSMPAPGDRPPHSDERRMNMPAPQQGPRAASLKGSDDRLDGIVTVLPGSSYKLSSFEDKSLDEKYAAMEDEEVASIRAHASDTLEGKREVSYADAHQFNFVRSSGKQKGTLYYADGDRMLSRRVK